MASTSLPIGYRYATPIELIASGKSPTSRQVVTPAGDFIPRRQAEKIDAQSRGYSTKEEQRAAAKSSGISRDVQDIRNSFRKQADKYGLDTKIRGNAEYQKFKQELQDLQKSYPDLLKSLGKQRGRDEYQLQRIDIYLKFGLISKADYDKYKGV
jgi:hypothetical protein